MTSIIIADPVQNDQVVDLQSVFLIRESIPYEQRESPGAITCVYAGGADLLSSEPLASLLSKFSSLRLARLTAPSLQPLFVNMDHVIDADRPIRYSTDPRAHAILYFTGPPHAAHVAVVETAPELAQIWHNAGVPTTPFDRFGPG